MNHLFFGFKTHFSVFRPCRQATIFGVLFSLVLLGLFLKSFSEFSHQPIFFIPYTLHGSSQSVQVASTTIFLPMNRISILPQQSLLYSPNPCNCLPDISTWISYRYFKLNMCKLNSSSLKPAPLLHSLSQEMAAFSTQLIKPGIYD